MTGLANPLHNTGKKRTDLHCHNCSKDFYGTVDHAIDGPHQIRCPYCHHIHFRVIKEGAITEDRFDADPSQTDIIPAEVRVWKAPDAPIITSSASYLLRERWLNRSDIQQ